MILILLITLLITLLAILITKLLLLISTKQALSDNELMSKGTRKYYEIGFLEKASNIASNVDINSNSNMLKKKKGLRSSFFWGKLF